MAETLIESPDDTALDELCGRLRTMAGELDAVDAWVGRQLELCARYGVFRWFLPVEHGGIGWSEADVVRGYLKLSAACLTTTFVITQRTGAVQRIAVSENEELLRELLADLLEGRTFATVGISHLTTSRRFLAKPVLRAHEVDGRFVLDGYSPWVTGSRFAQFVVTGATLEDQRQILVALPTDSPGVHVPPAEKLVGLSASQTGRVELRDVVVDRRWLLAGPIENVMQAGLGAKTGGLQTSTLAVGLAAAAIAFIEREGEQRSELVEPADKLRSDHDACVRDLHSAAEGNATCSNEQLRIRANSLVLRAAQAALAAAKGAGYVVGHPAGRWCQQALFFLVWSCPQPVLAANLCELAGLDH